jgi:hypothetical protein
MTNATPALLAVLLVLSLPAIPVVGAGPDDRTTGSQDAVLPQETPSRTEPIEVENTTNRLHLGGKVRSEYTEYGPNLGMALASADDRLRVDHDQYIIVDSEFDAATDEERAAMIQTAYERLMQRAEELKQRERDVVRAHAAGERSSTEVLQTLLRNHNEAEILIQHLETVENRAAGVSGYSLSASKVRADRKALEYHRTSLRMTLERLSNRPTRDVHHDVIVSTSDTGYSVAIMDESQYFVETSRFDNRDETAPDRFQNGEAYDHTTTLYPWASEYGPHFQDNSPDYYWAEMGHDHGRLEFYFDSGTGDVYREMQQLSAASLPTIWSQTWSQAELSLTITQTPANGPAKVTVTDSETGAPVRSTVSVDGVELGETNEDGGLWIAQPVGSYNLTVESQRGSVNATITDSY